MRIDHISSRASLEPSQYRTMMAWPTPRGSRELSLASAQKAERAHSTGDGPAPFLGQRWQPTTVGSLLKAAYVEAAIHQQPPGHRETDSNGLAVAAEIVFNENNWVSRCWAQQGTASAGPGSCLPAAENVHEPFRDGFPPHHSTAASAVG
jgi:hypothetical protein